MSNWIKLRQITGFSFHHCFQCTGRTKTKKKDVNYFGLWQFQRPCQLNGILTSSRIVLFKDKGGSPHGCCWATSFRLDQQLEVQFHPSSRYLPPYFRIDDVFKIWIPSGLRWVGWGWWIHWSCIWCMEDRLWQKFCALQSREVYAHSTTLCKLPWETLQPQLTCRVTFDCCDLTIGSLFTSCNSLFTNKRFYY